MFQRLGPWMHDHRRWVLGFWLTLLVGINLIGGAVGPDFRDEFNLPDVESKRGIDILTEEFGGEGAGQEGTIVFKADQGVNDPEVKAAMGKLIAKALTEKGIPFVVAESNRESVEALRAKGIPAVWGDATEPMVLIQAHIREARALVIATPETIQVRKMVETARTLNPEISVVVRSHNGEVAARLENDGSGTVFVGETELAKSMVGCVLGLVVPAAPVVAPRH